MITEIFGVCDRIHDGRTLSDIMTHLTSEVGELADEVIIANGRSYKPAGPDGIVGEAVDVIICAVDIIRRSDPTITEEQIQDYCNKKLAKWLLTTLTEMD